MLALCFPGANSYGYVSSRAIVTGEPAFAKNNWHLEVAKNRPIGHTGNRLSEGNLTYTFGFRYFYDPNWLMGASLGFRSFKENLPGDPELTYFSFTHEAFRVFR